MIFAGRFMKLYPTKKPSVYFCTFTLYSFLSFSNRHSIWHGSVVHTTTLDSEYWRVHCQFWSNMFLHLWVGVVTQIVDWWVTSINSVEGHSTKFMSLENLVLYGSAVWHWVVVTYLSSYAIRMTFELSRLFISESTWI